MATTLEELEIKFKASFGDVNAKLSGLENKLKGLDSVASKTQKAFSGMGRIIKTFATVYVGRALVNVGKDSLAMANEVVESENLFSESMRSMSGAARDWSDRLRDTLGLNAFELRKNAGTMNVMLKSMGIGETQAYDMAVALTELSEDMASFYNMSSADMYAKLQSGMTGMAMPLKQIGILIDDHTLKQYAQAAGIQNTTGELTQQEKVLARYAAIMAQTTSAQGDLARTIDSPANQLRVLSNTVDQAKVALGRAAQTIQAAIMPTLSRLASAALTAAQAIAYLMGGLGGLGKRNIAAELTTKKGATATENLASKLTDTADAYKKAGGAAKKAAKDASVGLKAFDEINKITEEAAKGGGGGGGGGGIDDVTLPELDDGSFLDDLEAVNKKVRELADKIREAADLVVPALAGLSAGFIAFKLTGNPAVGLVVGVLGAGITALVRYADQIREARLAEAFGTIEISLEEAATIISNNLRTKTTDMLDAVEGLSEETDRALQRYAAAVEYTKKVTMTLQLLTMRTGYENFTRELADLKKRLKASGGEVRVDVLAYLDALLVDGNIDLTEYNRRRTLLEERLASLDNLAENLVTTVTAQVDAALEDGKVDDKEKTAIIATLDADAKKVVQGWNALKAEMYAEVDADLKAGYITKDGAKAQKTDIDAMITEKVAEFGIATAGITAQIGTINWTEKALTPEQLESYQEAVQAQADAAGTLIAEVEIELTARGKAALGDDYSGSATEAAFSNLFDAAKENLETADAEIERLFAEALSVGMTPEIMSAIQENLNTQRDAAEMLANGGLTDRALWAKTLATADGLSKESIDNLITAQADYVASEETRIRENGEILANTLWNGLADGDDPALVHAAVKELGDAIEADVVELKSGAAINAAKTFMPELSKAIASGKLSISELIGYRDQIDKVFEGIDYSSLTEEAQRAALEMIVPFMTNVGPGGEMMRILSEGGIEFSEIMETVGQDAMMKLGLAMMAGKLDMNDMNMLFLNPTKEGLEQLAQKLEAGGEKAMADLVRGLKEKAPDAKEAGKDIAEAVKTGAGSVDTTSVGEHAADGVIKGVNNKISSIKAAGATMASALKIGAGNTLQISSPSKVFAWIGEMSVAGLVNSLASGIPDVSSISERLANAAIDGMAIDASALDASPLSIASGSVSLEAGAGISGAIETGIARGVQSVMDALNINLNVDGQVLGRVAIKGINQATRAAGTMLLEF